MGVAYQRLSEPGSRRVGARARAWAALRRAASGPALLYAARRRWAARRLARARERRAKAAAAGYEYDSASYARNFDDGVWKPEEGVFWSAGTSSFAACRRARAASALQ